MENQESKQKNSEKTESKKSQVLLFFKILAIVIIGAVVFLYLAFLGFKSFLVYVDETTVSMEDECNLGCYATCYFNYDRGWENYSQFQNYMNSLFFKVSNRKKMPARVMAGIRRNRKV